ncbi:hypothetical protein RYX36_011060 [Vicia faba]
MEELALFNSMRRHEIWGDLSNVANILSAASSLLNVKLVTQMHGHAFKFGETDDIMVPSALLDAYSKCQHSREACKIFSELKAYDMQMRFNVVRPSAIIFIGVISACDHCGLVEEGRNLFHTVKHEYAINTWIEHYSCMVELFARAGCFGEATYLIEEMPFQADANMWLSVLRGCISYGNKTIGKMAVEKIIPIDPKNSCAYIQLSNILATSEDWEGSAKVRELMLDKNVQKITGGSWADC